MFTQVEVTGTLRYIDDTAIQGATVQWSLTSPVWDDSTGAYLSSAPITSEPSDANGAWSITVDALDDLTTQPFGQKYRVEIQVPSQSVSGPLGIGSYFPVYYVNVPAAAAPTVDFALLISSAVLPVYVGPTGPSGGPTGPTGVRGPTGPSGGPTGPTGALPRGSAVADSTDTSNAALQLNALLDALRAANVIAK